MLKHKSTSGKIISVSDNWFTGIVAGRWVQAKLYTEPSEYGVSKLFKDPDENGEHCRVSKLVISKTSTRNRNQNFFDQMCFSYDRGLDFDEIGVDGLLEKIATWLDWFAENRLVEYWD